MTTVFLGGGRITSAMLAGLRLAGYRQHLVVHDINPAKLRRLKREYAVSIEPDLARAVADSDILVVAVRPESVHDLLMALQSVISIQRDRGRPMIAVSFAAGVPLVRLGAAPGFAQP